jgi:hypothetical protein
MTKRPRSPKVTKADLDRAVALVRALGLKPGAIEVEAGRVRILTGDRALTLPNDNAELDRELAEWDARHGFDAS